MDATETRERREARPHQPPVPTRRSTLASVGGSRAWGMGLGPMFSALLRAAGYARVAGMERSGNAMVKQHVTDIRADSTFSAITVLALLNNVWLNGGLLLIWCITCITCITYGNEETAHYCHS